MERCLQCGRSLTEFGCTASDCILYGLEQTEDNIQNIQDYRRQQIVQEAFGAAEDIINKMSNGSPEETELLKAEVFWKYADMMVGIPRRNMARRDLDERMAKIEELSRDKG